MCVCVWVSTCYASVSLHSTLLSWCVSVCLSGSFCFYRISIAYNSGKILPTDTQWRSATSQVKLCLESDMANGSHLEKKIKLSYRRNRRSDRNDILHSDAQRRSAPFQLENFILNINPRCRTTAILTKIKMAVTVQPLQLSR